MRLFLVGFMGSGKTTVGAALSRARGTELVDLDDWIEQYARMTVREIFEQKGEPYFRELEHEALRAVGEKEDVVVATGGGTFTFPRNQELIHDLGTSVFLHPSFATIMGRIGSLGKRTRPLFRTEVDALALYRSRLPAYRSAHLVVEIAEEETPEEVAARIALRVAEARGTKCDT